MRHKAEELHKHTISKEEEIIAIKKKFGEDKWALELEKKKSDNALVKAKEELDRLEVHYWEFWREQDESPMAVLRA